MNRNLVQLRAVFMKEFRQTFRDRRMIASMLIGPIMQLVVFGYALNFNVDHVSTVVVDQDGGATGREAVDALLADGTLDFAGYTDEAGAEAALEHGDAAAAIIFPPGFGREVDGGRSGASQVLLDGSDPVRGGVVASAVGRYFASHGAKTPAIHLDPKVYYNPTQKTAVYMVPGTAAMQLLQATTLLAAMGLSREKELGTMEQVLVSPIPTSILMLGKVLPFIGIGFVNMSTALLLSAVAFGVPLQGSITCFGAAIFTYVLSTLGAGLFISTVSANQQQAFLGGFLMMIPTILLSGNMTPIQAMPAWLAPITYLNPLRYFIAILRAELLRNAGWADLWPQVLALLCFGVVILTAASIRFRKTLA